MNKQRSLEPRTEDYLAQIERYESHPIVTGVLIQDTTFTREVEDFYNLSTYLTAVPRAGIVREFDFRGDRDINKKGKYPINLVEILKGFSEEPLNPDKLQYDSVREDYRRWNKPLRRIIRTTVGLGGMLGGIGGLVACLINALNGNPEIAIPSGIAGAVGLGASFWVMIYPSKPKGTNYELEEFVKLNTSAAKADSFMERHYRKYFIKKALAKK